MLAYSHTPSYYVSFCSNYGVVLAEAMPCMSTRISRLLLSVRNCHASVKMETEPTLSLWQWSEGRRSHVLPGRLDWLSSNRI